MDEVGQVPLSTRQPPPPPGAAGAAPATAELPPTPEAATPWDAATLLAGMRTGDVRALRALYDRYSGTVRGVVWSLLGTDPDHEDVVQQVYCNLAAGLRGLRDPEALPGFVRSVAVKTVRKSLRKRQRGRWLGLAGTPEDLAASDPSHGVLGARARPEARVLVSRFYQVLGRMKPDDRIAFTLRFVDELSLPEVAEAGGWSLSTAKRRVTRATERFWRIARADFWLAALAEEQEAPP